MSDDPKRYSDGWPVGPDDGLATAMYDACVEPAASGCPPFGALDEWQRDEYRDMARVARAWIAAEQHEAAEDALRAQLRVEQEAAALEEREARGFARDVELTAAELAALACEDGT